MTGAANVEGSEALRLFFGLRAPTDAVAALRPWQAQTFGHLAEVRVVPDEALHLTLAFLGARPRAELEDLRTALRETAGDLARPVLRPLRYCETEHVAMLVLDDEDRRAGLLQERLASRLEALGAYRRERRPWLPHLTVARFRRRPRLRPELPALGPFSPSDAALYHSVLRPDGAQYQILEAVALGG
jgi:RNA 2',3'-cyclic 3'-phosphodiesterase